MKVVIAAAALGSSFALARPPLSFPFYGGVNSSSIAASLLTTGVSNCTLSATNVTADAALASETGSTAPCGCSTALETTTVYVFAPDSSSLGPSTPSPTSSSALVSSTSSEPYVFSIVNGTTAWHNDNAPPSGAILTVVSTISTYSIDLSSTEVTSTVTSQRTLTSTVPSDSSIRTETIVVTETSLTTIHASLPPGSSGTETTSMIGDGIVDSSTSPAEIPELASSSLTITITVESRSPATTSTLTNTAPSDLESSSDTLVDGNTLSSSSESDITVFVTSSRIITVSRSSATSSQVSDSSSPLSIETEASTPTVVSPVLSDTSSTESTLTAGAPTTTFPSLSPSGTEGVTFSGSGTGTAVPATGTISTLGSSTSPSSVASSVPSNGTCTDSPHESGVSTELTETTTFSQMSTSSSAGPQSTASGETNDSGHPPFTNSTLADPIATQSTSVNESSTSIITGLLSETTSFVESWTPQTSSTTLTTSASSVGSGGNDSSSSLSTSLFSVSPVISVVASSTSSTEGNPMVPSPNSTADSTTTISRPSSVATAPENTYTTTEIITIHPPISSSTSTLSKTIITITSPVSSSFETSTSVFANATLTNIGYGHTAPYPSSSIVPTGSSIVNGSANCGEIGDFVMNWDDEPVYVQTTEDDPPYAPVFNPYHHLFFANGFAYYDPDHSISKPEPYDPVSGPNVAIFHVHGDTPIADRDEKDEFDMLPGVIGAGPRAKNKIYWFNAYSAELGCDNGGTSPCNMTISGYVWNETSKQEEKTITQTAFIQPCNLIEDCTLQHVELVGFEGVSSIRFEAVVDGSSLKSWVTDNLNMGWYDNSCEAGRKRINAKK